MVGKKVISRSLFLFVALIVIILFFIININFVSAICGNNLIEPNGTDGIPGTLDDEECDNGGYAGEVDRLFVNESSWTSCLKEGFNGGKLICNPPGSGEGIECKINTNNCYSCTDGIRNGFEAGIDCGGDPLKGCPADCWNPTICTQEECFSNYSGSWGVLLDLSSGCCAVSNNYCGFVEDPFITGPIGLCGTNNTACNDPDNVGAYAGVICYQNRSITYETLPTCSDGIQNGDEDGIDCGGSYCDVCTCGNGVIDAGEDCDLSAPIPFRFTSSCKSEGFDHGKLYCEASLSCKFDKGGCGSCNDGAQNGDETGVDCGGSCSASCVCNEEDIQPYVDRFVEEFLSRNNPNNICPNGGKLKQEFMPVEMYCVPSTYLEEGSNTFSGKTLEISSAGGGFLILIANEFWLEEDFISKATFLGKIILRGFNEYPNDFFKDKDKEQLIFHELGHAVFRHGHDESLTTRPGESSMSFIPPLFPSSIMNPRRINTVDYIQYRDFYLDSFFSQRDPAVYIDCNPSSPSLSPPIIEQKDKNIFDFISNLFSKFLFIFTNVPEEEPLLAPTVSTRLFINNQGPNFLTTGVCSPSFVITHEDYSGNLVNVDLDTLITLSGQGGGAFYSDPSCLNVISSVDILTGSSSAIFYYKPGLLAEELSFIADSLDSEQGELSISVFKSLYPPVNEPNITCGDGSLPCELCQGFNFNNGVCEALFTFECGGSAYEYGTLQECQLANAPPANLTSVTLTSSNSTTNYTSEDLIATVNPDVNPNLKLTYSWYRNNQSIAVLDMPFESNGGSEGSFVKDYTSFKNNGNVSEAVWVATGGYDGKGAYIFDGSDDYILIQNSSELALTQGFTITAWTNAREFTNEIIICKGPNAADPDYALDLGVGFRDIGFYDGDLPWKQSNSNILSSNVWNHIVFVYDGSNYKFYLNGIENGTVAKTGDIQTSLSDLMIGQQCQFGVNAYNGTLDEIKIYDNALSSQQIQNIYSNQFNLISNQETYVDDVWRVEVTSNDGVSDVNTVVSNDLLINSFCGDGQAGGSEQCDGFDLKDNTCLTQSFQHGTLTCNADCTFNTGSCGVCYNGIQDGNETGVDCGGGYCADCPPASGTCPVGEIFIDGEWVYQQNLLKGRVTKNVEGVSYERIRSNVDEEVIVRITESIGDKTYLNSLSLIEINHEKGTEAYLDSNGKAWQINGEEKQLIINQEDLDNDKFGFELTVDSLDNAIILKGSLTDSIIESWREYWKDEVRVQCLPGLYTVLDSLSEETVNSFLRKEAGILVEANVNGEWQEVNNGDLILERNEEAFVVLPEGTEKVRVSYPDGAYEFDNLRVVNDIEEVEVREIKSSVAELNNFDEDYVIVTNDRPLVLEFSVDNVEGETYYFKSHGYYHYFEDFECESPSLRWDVALRYLGGL